MKFKTLVPIATALVLAACGTQDKKGSDKAADSQPTPEALAAEQAPAQIEQAPEMIIAKVPLDANGNEMTDQIETRSLATVGDQADAAQQFAAGQAIDVRDELDQDSSSQQWGGAYWNTPWYPGKLLGRGLWWGGNPYTSYGYGNSYGGYGNSYGNSCGGYSGCGSSYGNSYGGYGNSYGYSYSYGTTYRSGGCNYYTYARPTPYNYGY